MSTKDPFDPLQDPDHTILVPVPGGRRAAVPVPTDVVPPAVNPAMPAQTPVTSTYQADKTEIFSTATAARPAIATLDAGRDNATASATVKLHGKGLNPLVAAANPLLDLAMPLRHMASYPQVENLRLQLIAAIKVFEDEAKTALVEHDAIAAARFSLCTFLDEIISSTPWGGGGVWASRSLLVNFHNESSGGEKFFLILQKLCQNPRANIQILELMYLCLVLGMEGRFRVIEGGKSQLEVLRERLHQLIQKEHGAFEPELSVHWQGARGKGESLWRMIPVWVLVAIAAAFLILLQLTLSYRLSFGSDSAFESLFKIKVEAPPVVAALPQATLVQAPVRVAEFLAPEIVRGLVSVTETADRSTITLHGDGVFSPGSAEVKDDFIPLLKKIGDALKPISGNVIVIGHTDSTKGFSAKFPSNWDLSKGRAAAVRDFLAERAGPIERYRVEGRGDTEPLVQNNSAANRARNRRVGIIVLTPVIP